jgi:hypothetical protein
MNDPSLYDGPDDWNDEVEVLSDIENSEGHSYANGRIRKGDRERAVELAILAAKYYPVADLLGLAKQIDAYIETGEE